MGVKKKSTGQDTEVKMIYVNAWKYGYYAWRGIQVGSIKKEIE